MSCEVMASAGMCHFPVQVFNTFLDGTSEGLRKVYEICGCSCRGNNEDIYDSGGVNSTCIDIIPLRADNNDGSEHALLASATGETLLDASNLAGSRIRLGSNVGCELFTDPENQCGMTLREATGDEPSSPVLLSDVSEGAKELKVSEWCRDLCCGTGANVAVEDAGCGECRSESVAMTYVYLHHFTSVGHIS
jgi:hypothetical protein